MTTAQIVLFTAFVVVGICVYVDIHKKDNRK